MNLARTLRKLRKTLKISRMELAQRTGYSIWAITAYEQGKRRAGPRFLEKMDEVRRAAGLRGRAAARKIIDPWGLKTILLSVEDRLRAVESRCATLELRVRELGRGEAIVGRPAEASGVQVRGAIEVGGREPGAAGGLADEKAARAKER